MNWAARYVGLPFADIGFSAAGVHCWGLVCLVYERELGIALPRHDTITAEALARTARAFKAESVLAPWLVVESRRDFDVVLMGADNEVCGRVHRLPSHIGIAVGPDRVLHVERGINAVCVADNHPSIRHRIIGAWRHGAVP